MNLGVRLALVWPQALMVKNQLFAGAAEDDTIAGVMRRTAVKARMVTADNINLLSYRACLIIMEAGSSRFQTQFFRVCGDPLIDG